MVGRRRERPTPDAKQLGAEAKSDADKQVSVSGNAGQAAMGTSPASASAIIEGPEASNRTSDSEKAESGSGQPQPASSLASSSSS